MISSNETSNTKMCIVHKFDQLKLVTNEFDQKYQQTRKYKISKITISFFQLYLNRNFIFRCTLWGTTSDSPASGTTISRKPVCQSSSARCGGDVGRWHHIWFFWQCLLEDGQYTSYRPSTYPCFIKLEL